MLCVNLNDRVLKQAKNKRISKYTKLGTQVVLWSGFGSLVITGTIPLVLLGELTIIGCFNKATKWVIKNRKMIKRKLVKNKLVKINN